jgi:hypothetical protein
VCGTNLKLLMQQIWHLLHGWFCKKAFLWGLLRK